jgi:L-ascorbate metabolism protein UlaG (beta-lactamase superfamily)
MRPNNILIAVEAFMLRTRGNKITWLGHSTFKITTPSGKVILIDPWITGNPACPDAHKKTERVDLLLITHGHSDHLGDAVGLAKQHRPRVVAIYETALWLASKGVENTQPMGKGGTQKIDDVEVTMVHAIHSNSIEDGGNRIYGGEPCGYVLRLPGGLALYHAGDTTAFSDMKLIGELYAPELACLPIGDLYTMGPREAAMAVRLLNVHHVVPMHYGTFPALRGTHEELRHHTQDVAGLEIHVLKPGESIG